MKMIFRKWLAIWALALVSGLVASCSDNDKDEITKEAFGYLQFFVTKDLNKSGALDQLNDAKVLEFTLVYHNRDVKQVVELYGNDRYLTSEKIELLAGEYVLKSYRVFDANGNELQGYSPETGNQVLVRKGIVNEHQIVLNSVLRGTISFVIDKDRTLLQKSAQEQLERYEFIRRMDVKLRSTKGEVVFFKNLPLKINSKTNLFETDTTLHIQANDYRIEYFTLFDQSGTTLVHEQTNQKYPLSVSEAKHTLSTIDVILARTAAIEDYYVLKAIWDKMDGEKWSWVISNVHVLGDNWNFDKPVDEWGNQPGVVLHSNGRVKGLNIGGFNPSGPLAEEIGDLSELEALWIGSHSDLQYVDLSRGASLSQIRHMKRRPSFDSGSSEWNGDIIAPTKLTNRITAIPESIGKLTKLSALFIANNLVTELPESIGNLESLTDLEVFNLNLTKFPTGITNMPSLISLSLALTNLTDEMAWDGLKAMANGPAGKTLQLLYLDHNRLTKLPPEMNELRQLGLLDVSYNLLTSFPSMPNVSPVMLYGDINKITSLPDDLCILDDIEEINFSFNKLSRLPLVFDANGRYAMLKVDFSNNLISQIPDEFKGFYAEEVDLSFNRLTEFSRGLANSKVLSLNLSKNQIHTIHEGIVAMKDLRALELSSNELTQVPEFFHIENFIRLEGLSLAGNRLSEIPGNLFGLRSLTSLLIGYQRDANGNRILKSLPEVYSKCYSLRVLDLAGNDLRRIEKLPYYLNFADVSNNPRLILDVSEMCERFINGTFVLVSDPEQNLLGCSVLD